METISKKVTTKIFMGIILNPEIKAKLHRHSAWQQESLGASMNEKKLTSTFYHGKEYLGFFLKSRLTTKELKEAASSLLEQFNFYLPKEREETSKLTIFPQIFIS